MSAETDELVAGWFSETGASGEADAIADAAEAIVNQLVRSPQVTYANFEPGNMTRYELLLVPLRDLERAPTVLFGGPREGGLVWNQDGFVLAWLNGPTGVSVFQRDEYVDPAVMQSRIGGSVGDGVVLAALLSHVWDQLRVQRWSSSWRSTDGTAAPTEEGRGA